MQKILKNSIYLNLSSSFSLAFTAFILPFLYGLNSYGNYIKESFISLILVGLIEILIVDMVKKRLFNILSFFLFSLPFYILIYIFSKILDFSFINSIFLFFAISLRSVFYYNNILNSSGAIRLIISEFVFVGIGFLCYFLSFSFLHSVVISFVFSIFPYLKNTNLDFRFDFPTLFEFKKCILVFFSRLNEDVFYMFIPFFFSSQKSNELGASIKISLSFMRILYKLIPLRYESLTSLHRKEFEQIFSRRNIFVFFLVFNLFLFILVVIFLTFDLFIDFYAIFWLFPVVYLSNIISPIVFLKNQIAAFVINSVLSAIVIFLLYYIQNFYHLTTLFFLVYFLFLIFSFKIIRSHYASVH